MPCPSAILLLGELGGVATPGTDPPTRSPSGLASTPMLLPGSPGGLARHRTSYQELWWRRRTAILLPGDPGGLVRRRSSYQVALFGSDPPTRRSGWPWSAVILLPGDPGGLGRQRFSYQEIRVAWSAAILLPGSPGDAARPDCGVSRSRPRHQGQPEPTRRATFTADRPPVRVQTGAHGEQSSAAAAFLYSYGGISTTAIQGPQDDCQQTPIPESHHNSEIDEKSRIGGDYLAQ